MSTTTKQTVVQLWQYQCPDCGFSDSELGHHLPHEAIYCEVCLEDERQVRLKRWPADTSDKVLE